MLKAAGEPQEHGREDDDENAHQHQDRGDQELGGRGVAGLQGVLALLVPDQTV